MQNTPRARPVPTMNLPKNLKIGAHTFRVILCELPEDVDGETNTGTNTIKINKNLSPSQQRVTLFHEIFHAMNSELAKDVWHALMESLVQQLYQVLHDNKMLK